MRGNRFGIGPRIVDLCDYVWQYLPIAEWWRRHLTNNPFRSSR